MASSDPKLVNAARHHAPAAWDTLLKQHQLPLYAYVAELVRDKATALDLVQETFASAVKHIGSLRDDARFGPWLFGIAQQKCVQHWRRGRRTKAIFAAEPIDAAENDWPEVDALDPRTMLLRREQADEYLAFIDQLPAEQRSAFLLQVLEDFSLDEIATISGVPVGTVKSRLHHAKRTLRQLLEAAR